MAVLFGEFSSRSSKDSLTQTPAIPYNSLVLVFVRGVPQKSIQTSGVRACTLTLYLMPLLLGHLNFCIEDTEHKVRYFPSRDRLHKPNQQRPPPNICTFGIRKEYCGNRYIVKYYLLESFRNYGIVRPATLF